MMLIKPNYLSVFKNEKKMSEKLDIRLTLLIVKINNNNQIL